MSKHNIIYNKNITKKSFSLLNKIYITKGNMQHWQELKKYHYRGHGVFPAGNVFSLWFENKLIGVILYSRAPLGSLGRTKAFGIQYSVKKFGRKNVAKLVNNEIRLMSRLVIHPLFRGLGLAYCLQIEVQDWLGVPIIESLSEIGKYSKFMEKAGFKKIEINSLLQLSSVRKILVFLDKFGIERSLLADKDYVEEKIKGLPEEEKQRFNILLLKECKKYYGAKTAKSRTLEFTTEKVINWFSRQFYSNPAYYYYLNKTWREFRGNKFPERLYLGGLE